MPESLVIAKIITCMIGAQVTGYSEGTGAFYHQASLRDVCEWRVERNWNPGLHCGWPCLAAWGRHEPEMLGAFVLADLPGGGFHVCEIVDVRQEAHEAENGHIIIEVDGETAAECGWQSYVPNVRVWRLASRGRMWYDKGATDGHGFFDSKQRGYARSRASQ